MRAAESCSFLPELQRKYFKLSSLACFRATIDPSAAAVSTLFASSEPALISIVEQLHCFLEVVDGAEGGVAWPSPATIVDGHS